jgi:protein involved in polysaccharide export with SLBB domain
MTLRNVKDGLAAALMVLMALLSPVGSGLLAAQTPPAATTTAAPAAARASVAGDYVLGPGDKVRVIVFGEEGLSGEFVVGGAGKVSFPLIGDVAASGLPVQAFQAELENGLKQGYLKSPRVSVEVLTYRPYYILGEVNKPGEYPYSNGLNVLNSIATAGGFTYRAQTKRVFIRRANETTERPYALTSSVQVAPGDTIRVTERFF